MYQIDKENNDLIKLRQENSCITFKASNYDGKTKTFIVPFVSIHNGLFS